MIGDLNLGSTIDWRVQQNTLAVSLQKGKKPTYVEMFDVQLELLFKQDV